MTLVFRNGIASFMEFIPSTSWIGLRISALASFDGALDERMHASAVNQE
ncbi:MAG TPA: hypothetical protein VNN20_09770 [Thermodesulfobacteriota bacterium]|nr:hypothetical protein [Thermodesulfobacteriota bacterium]